MVSLKNKIMPYKEKPIKKVYCTIGEVAKTLDIKNTSQIRFWCEEIPINVKKNNKGNRQFTMRKTGQIELVQQLTNHGLTLQGVKDFFKDPDKFIGRLEVLRLMTEIFGNPLNGRDT